MPSEVDIANLALAHLGDDAGIVSFDPPDGSPQAEHAARFYQLARDTMLESHGWSFATRTVALAPMGIPPEEWLYSYAVPNGCVKPLHLYTAGTRRANEAQPWELEVTADGQPILFSDCAAAMLRFIARSTDPTRFPPLFVEALSWLLASMLAGPVLKGDAGAQAGQSCYKIYLIRLAEAVASDATRSRTRIDPQPAWIASR